MSNTSDLFNFTCDALYQTYEEGEAAPFRNTPSITKAHENAPRFGYSSEILDLIVGSKEEGQDYLKGLLVGPFVMFIFFMVWLLLVMLFKCLGHRRVGLLSGHKTVLKAPPALPDEMEQPAQVHDKPSINESDAVDAEGLDELPEQDLDEPTSEESKKPFYARWFKRNPKTEETQDPDTPVDYETAYAAWEEDVARTKRRVRWVRIALFCSSLAIIVCAILFIYKGIDSLIKTMDETRNGLSILGDLSQQAIDVIEEFVEEEEKAEAEIDELLADLNGFCPKVRQELCTDYTTATECNVTDIPFAEEIDEVLDYFNGTKGLIYNELEKFRDSLEQVIADTEYLKETTKTFNWAFYVAAVFVGSLAFLCLLIMGGLVMVWTGRMNCFLNCIRGWFIVPLFVFLVIMTFIFAIVFIIGSTAVADLCVDAPDSRLLAVIGNQGFGSLVTPFASYFVGGCVPEEKPINLDDQYDKIGEYLDVIAGLSGAVTEIAPGVLQDVCAVDPDQDVAGPILTVASVVQVIVCILEGLLFRLRAFFSCGNWRPLYETMVHRAVCYETADGFRWISTTMTVIVFMSFIMLTLRVGFYEIADESVEEAERRRWATCRRVVTCGMCNESAEQDEQTKEGQDAPLVMEAEDQAEPSSEKPEFTTASVYS